MTAETEDNLNKRLNEWKDFVENRGMRVNKNKTNVIISGQRQKVTKKAVRWLCGVCGRGVGNNSHTQQTQPFYGSVEFVRDNPGEPVPIQYSVIVARSGYTRNVVV